jgi:hypothetical protein
MQNNGILSIPPNPDPLPPIDLRAAALEYHAAGLKVIPWKNDLDPKKQFPAWKKYREGQTAEDVEKLFAQPHERLCILCTDDIEAIDIDLKADPKQTIVTEFLDLCQQDETAAAALAKCVLVRTKSKGMHIVYRASNVEKNQKLAYRAKGEEAIIETRGSAGCSSPPLLPDMWWSKAITETFQPSQNWKGAYLSVLPACSMKRWWMRPCPL